MNYRPSSFSHLPEVVKNLLIINGLFFLATITLDGMGFDMYHLFGLHQFQSDDFMPHQLVTHIFMHGNFTHLFFNMFTLWMFGKTLADGFDIVIGNPPYIKEYTDRSVFDGLRQSAYYQGKMDIWYLFACDALDRLKTSTGLLCFIATNNWVTNAGASIMKSAGFAEFIKLGLPFIIK